MMLGAANDESGINILKPHEVFNGELGRRRRLGARCQDDHGGA